VSAAVLIDADELAALRLLARKALAISETNDVRGLDAREADDAGDDPEEVAPLSVDVDFQVSEQHPDWYALTLNSRSLMCSRRRPTRTTSRTAG
jgi:hypothetical protein